LLFPTIEYLSQSLSKLKCFWTITFESISKIENQIFEFWIVWFLAWEIWELKGREVPMICFGKVGRKGRVFWFKVFQEMETPGTFFKFVEFSELLKKTRRLHFSTFD
jgi:hypothetical protein